MQLTIDLLNVRDKTSLLTYLDETLFIKDWGRNWDALNDCLHDLSEGGFTEKYDFPLSIQVVNLEMFKTKNPDDFKIFEKILLDQVDSHKNEGLELIVSFE